MKLGKFITMAMVVFMALLFISWGAVKPASALESDAVKQPKVNECINQKAEWIFCDDFEQNRFDQYFEYNDADGSFIRTDGVGWKKSAGMLVKFSKGQIDAGALHLAIGKTPQEYFRSVGGDTVYRDIYWRFYLKNESGWIGGGGDKLTRAISFASPDSWAEAAIAHVWSGGDSSTRDYLVMDPASGTDEQGNLQTTKYNDFANLRWLGAMQGATPLFDHEHVGKWYSVEIHAKLNDPGESNGLFEYWINNKREAQITDINWVGNFEQYGLNAIFMENYWNDGSTQDQERYIDNFVVSTKKIGPAQGVED